MADEPTNVAEIDVSSDAFLTARFAGGRFDSHALPLDVLPDLSAYRALLVQVAKALYKRKHPDRQRVPKGFEDSIQLGLTAVIGGRSAVAVIELLPPELISSQQASLFATIDEAPEARDFILRVAKQVQETGRVPEDFPRELAGRFNEFGQNLKSGEHIDLSTGNLPPVRYDSRVRRAIVLSGEAVYENPVDARFILNGGQDDKGVIHVLDETQFQTFDFRPLTDYDFEKAYARRRHVVRLVGTGMFSRQEKLKRLVRVDQIIYTDDEAKQAPSERLDFIAALPDGWHEPDTPSPSLAAVARMRQFIDIVTEAAAPNPYLYPNFEGGVTAEWSIEAWQITASIAPGESQVSFHAFNVATNQMMETQIDVDAVDAIAVFTRTWALITDREGPLNAN